MPITPTPFPTSTAAPLPTPYPTLAPNPTGTAMPVPTDPPLPTLPPNPTATGAPVPTDTPLPTLAPNPTGTAMPVPTDPPLPTLPPNPTGTAMPVPTDPPLPTLPPPPTLPPGPTLAPMPIQQYVWGANLKGQLGVGNLNSAQAPKPLGLPGEYAEMQFGAANGAFLKYDGSLWITGDNFYGQLGQGERGYISGSCNLGGNLPPQNGTCSPVQEITTSDWIDYSLGDPGAILAVKDDGSLWGWGVLQLTFPSIQYKPKEIGTTEDFAKVATGLNAYYAIKNDGSMWSWGRNYQGQLGISASGSVMYYVMSGGMASVSSGSTDWSEVFTAGYSAYGIKNDGSLYAWGQNNYYQLGDGTNQNRSAPTQIGSGITWTNLNPTGSAVVGIASGGTVYGWGANTYGGLDNGQQNVFFSVPTQIGSGAFTAVEGSQYATAVLSSGDLYTTGSSINGNNAISGSPNLTRLTKVSVPFKWVGLGYGGGSSMGGFAAMPTATPTHTFAPQPTPAPLDNLQIKYVSNFTAYPFALQQKGFDFQVNKTVYNGGPVKIQFICNNTSPTNYNLTVGNDSPFSCSIVVGRKSWSIKRAMSDSINLVLNFGDVVTVQGIDGAEYMPGEIQGVIQEI